MCTHCMHAHFYSINTHCTHAHYYSICTHCMHARCYSMCTHCQAAPPVSLHGSLPRSNSYVRATALQFYSLLLTSSFALSLLKTSSLLQGKEHHKEEVRCHACFDTIHQHQHDVRGQHITNLVWASDMTYTLPRTMWHLLVTLQFCLWVLLSTLFGQTSSQLWSQWVTYLVTVVWQLEEEEEERIEKKEEGEEKRKMGKQEGKRWRRKRAKEEEEEEGGKGGEGGVLQMRHRQIPVTVADLQRALWQSVCSNNFLNLFLDALASLKTMLDIN